MANDLSLLGAGASGATGFSPSDVSGLKLWLKADAIVGLSDGDPVTTWADSSGEGRDAAQATASKKPTYQTAELNGKPVVRFDGVDDVLTFSIVALTDFSLFCVFYIPTVADYAGPIDWREFGISGFKLISNVNTDWRPLLSKYDGAAETSNQMGPTAYPPPYGFAIESWLSTPAYYENGSLQAISAGSAGWGNAGGAIAYSSFDYMAGDIAEIIVYDTALSAGNRVSVEDYLNNKYAIY